MSRVEVLLATMHRENTDFLKDMNIQTDIVVANQADTFAYSESTDERGNRVRFVTTAFRGVGRNRNIALDYSTNEILLFADDDMRYYDGYGEMIEKAFDENPKADIIVFNVDEKGDRTSKKIFRKSRVRVYNFARYGTVRIAIRRTALERSRLSFSLLFGGGAKFGSGEDSLFLRDALRGGLNIIAVPFTLAEVDSTQSSWFSGYNEKFLYDKGCTVNGLFPYFGSALKYVFAYKFSRRADFSFFKCASLMRKGMKYGSRGISYKEYEEGKR